VNTERLLRLARKPPRYLARRALDEARREALRAGMQRAAGGRGPLVAERLLPAGALEATAAGAAALLPFAAAAAQASAADPGLSARVAERGRRAVAREVELFGEAPVFAGRPPRWLEDVHSGHGWPAGNHRRIDYRNLGRPSDVKVAWELSRLRHLVALAQAVAVLGDDAAAAALDADAADWIARNPMGWTVNWTCTMEVALRAVNLICADAVLLAAGRPAARRREIVASLYQHGWFSVRHLEVSDLNGNHFLADAVGLIWLGRYFGGVGESPRWTRTGVQMVREAAAEQVLPDGLDHEGSLPYHVLVLEMFLTARVGAGEALAGIDPVLRRMLDALCEVTGPDGRVPNLGDDDGGRVLAFTGSSSRDARRVLALGAALLGHEGAARRAGRAVPEDALWLLGPQALAALPAQPQARATGPTHLAGAGVVVLGGGEDHVVVSTGPVGFRGRGGHGHLDAMSLEATLGGAPAVRDSGTATYTGDPALRNRLRDAPAHSGIVVDGLPYAAIGDEMALWAVAGDAPPEVTGLESGAGEQRVTVRQALPAREGSARHERTVRWRPGRLEIRDRVEAPAGAQLEARLHVPGPVEARSSHEARSERHTYRMPRPFAIERVPCSEAYGAVHEGWCLVVRETATVPDVEFEWTVELR
jgi:hypothetical protein